MQNRQKGMTHCDYLTQPIREPKSTIERACSALQGLDFEAIVCCGLGGLLVAPGVAMAMDKSICVVRKAEDKSNHSEFRVESAMIMNDRWVFLDDIICTGSTLRYVRNALQDMGFEAEVSTYLYNEGRLRDTRAGYAFWDGEGISQSESITDVGNADW